MLYHLRKLRHFISPETEYKVRRAAYTFLPAKSSPVDAVFHCCAWKTGSQWVRLVLSDPRFYMATGLTPIGVFNSPEIEKAPSNFHVRRGSVVTNFFVSYETYRAVDKPDSSKVFYVVRDPRDLLVSWYFSNRYSHRPTKRIDRWRREMEGMTDEEGIIFTVGLFHEIYDRMASWVDAADQDKNVLTVKFENLTGDCQQATWREVLDFVGLEQVSDKIMREILEFYKVEKLRPPSIGDSRQEKYGNAGAKRRGYLTPKVISAFHERYPDILDKFGYK